MTGRRDLRSERGQSLLLFLVLLPMLLAFTGLVVDGGNAYAQKRKVQNAADASALAAAQDLPPCPANDSTCDTPPVRSAILD